ncbi:MAG: hypothetical protein A2X86_17780 [Bdellovibrionales bacterium GWA2_49_15]|nr:MAG: hypothetical protein A2X86_17780 [Bdellovibrionales bacterium GWA2_49_15]HAZ14979.1 hypothetical protein [Bdellovibrionales bacterium]
MKLAIYFNSPALGGAERSMVHQLALLPTEWKISVFIPYIKSIHEIEILQSYLKSVLKPKFQFFEIIPLLYPAELYAQSRFGQTFAAPETILQLLEFQVHLRNFELHRYDLHWCNGNKIGLPLFLFLEKESARVPLIWHFRDYPESRLPYGFIWKLFSCTKLPLFLLGNSDSVCGTLHAIKGRGKVCRLYNPAGESFQFRKWDAGKAKFKMGLVSMLAPWKGLHVAMQYHQLLAREFHEIGLQNVTVYGANIYQTKGAHDHYAGSLQTFLKKFPNAICHFDFVGDAPPTKIFSEIDILFHPSLRPEPFGRVILEAFLSGVPVISFSDGGASELIEHGGYKIPKYHPMAYFETVKDIIMNEQNTRRHIELAFNRGQEINRLAVADMQNFLRNF